MTTRQEERSVPVSELETAFAHLRGTSEALDRLLADTDRSDPNYYVVLMAGQSARSAQRVLTDCLGGSWQ